MSMANLYAFFVPLCIPTSKPMRYTSKVRSSSSAKSSSGVAGSPTFRPVPEERDPFAGTQGSGAASARAAKIEHRNQQQCERDDLLRGVHGGGKLTGGDRTPNSL